MINPDIAKNLTTHTNSRQARNMLREVYGRYVNGKDRYPTARVASSVEAVPPRVQPVAKLLIAAWETIDLDEMYFWDMIDRASDNLLASGKEQAAGLVVAKSGLNAVNFGRVLVNEGQVDVMHGKFTPSEAIGLVNLVADRNPSSRAARFDENGDLMVPPIPDAVIVRDRPHGAASYFGNLPLFRPGELVQA